MSDINFDINKNSSFSIKELVQILWSEKKLILSILLPIFLLSIIVSINIPNKYISSAKIQIIDDKSNEALSSAINQFGGLSSISGVSISGTESKENLFLEEVQSREFLRHILTFDGINESIMASKGFDPISKKIIFNEKIFDSIKGMWVRSPPKDRMKIPTHIEVYESSQFNESFSVFYDKKTNFITISFKHFSPFFAHDFVNLVITEMDKINREKDLKEAEKSLDYLKIMLEKTNEKEIKDLISRLIESKLKVQMLANVNDNYIINVIDSPFVPEKKSEPKRSRIVLISLIIGFILTSLYIFTFKREY